MDENRREAVLWLDKAREDLQAARLLAGAGGAASIACFHCQQAVEKYLKACLVACDLEVPRTHDLEDLASRIIRPSFDIGATVDELRFVRAYAVAPRYPYFPMAQAEQDLQVGATSPPRT